MFYQYKIKKILCFAQAEEQHELWPCIQGQFLEPETDAEADRQMAIHADFLVNTKWDHLPEVRSVSTKKCNFTYIYQLLFDYT